MYCLDTDIIIDIFRGDEKLKEKFEKLVSLNIDFFITPITLCELYKGAYKSEKTEEGLKLIEDFIKSIDLLKFEDSSCKIFGKILNDSFKKGKPASEADLMIAAIVIENNKILITKNIKHFENIDGLRYEKW